MDNDDLSSENTFIPGFESINDLTQKASKAVVQAIRSSHSLPTAGDDFDYYSSFESFRRLMDMESTRILQMIQQIMRYHGLKGNLSGSSQAIALEDKFDVLVDANDQILERAGSFIDEASGIKKETALVIASVPQKVTPRTASWNKKVSRQPSGSRGASFRLLAAKNVQRPQLKFTDKVDNSYKPFIPKIKEKPNALKSLSESFTVPTSEDLEINDNYTYPHPYKYELDHFTVPRNQTEKVTPKEPVSVDQVEAILIDTQEELQKLSTILKGEVEIAVDLEHHSYRSYLGITCLMQISTRSQDFLIDTIELRNELHVLNEVFTDPAIVKVFHGAESDVEWLQRDLGLYVVNMFDTGQASRILSFARNSLSFLLKHYCNVEANKQFQLADWRIRPLPAELSRYAQEDTHYLLYIYDCIKNELLEQGNDNQNLLMSVIHRSTQICAKTYQKPQFGETQHMEFYRKSKKLFHSQQVAALKGIYEWRDKIAREMDESTGYVLPNHMLLQIAELLPREPQGILACCNPIPPLVRQNLNELHRIIKNSRELPIHKVKLNKEMKPTKCEHPKYSVDSLLHCPHDTTRLGEDRPTQSQLDNSLVSSQSTLFKSTLGRSKVEVKQNPIISFFGCKKTKNGGLTPSQLKADRIKAKFRSPFEKYLPQSKAEPSQVRTEVKMDIQTDIRTDQSTDKWRLLPNTVVPSASKTGNLAEEGNQEPLMKVNMGKDDAVRFNDEEEEEVEPVRHQFSKKRSAPSEGESSQMPSWRKVPSTEKADDLDTESSKQTASKLSVEQLEEEGFEAHDYSNTDYTKLFHESSSKKKRGKQKRKGKDYNPTQEVEESYKGMKKPKLSAASSKKSMTYNKSKTQMPKIHWPKR